MRPGGQLPQVADLALGRDAGAGVYTLPARSSWDVAWYNQPMAWSCPHEVDGVCKRRRKRCDPGEPGCVLRGRVHFLNPVKNPPQRPIASQQDSHGPQPGPDGQKREMG
jgi:hypothetical protein